MASLEIGPLLQQSQVALFPMRTTFIFKPAPEVYVLHASVRVYVHPRLCFCNIFSTFDGFLPKSL